ncbi:MAG: hypothetical protein ABJA76_12775 [Mucilaginibacter sp.]
MEKSQKNTSSQKHSISPGYLEAYLPVIYMVNAKATCIVRLKKYSSKNYQK